MADPDERELRRAYLGDMRQLVASRAGMAWAVIASLLGVAGILGATHYPERIPAIIADWTFILVLAVVNMQTIRRRPEWTIPSTVITMTLVGLGYCVYCAWLAVHAEQCVMGLIIFLTAMVVIFPWGLRGQAVVSISLILGHVLSVWGGTIPHLPVAYGVVTVSMSAVLTTLGAELLDAYRFAAYRHVREADRANAVKAQFLATVSHELRTPLNVILGYTDLLSDDAAVSDADRRDVLGRVRGQAMQLLELIQAMLDLNRMEAGALHFSAEEFRIVDALDWLRDGIPANWRKQNVQLDFSSTSGDSVLLTDRTKLQMILRNLVHNALKYTDQGNVKVEADTIADGERIRFVVSDTGSGIRQQDLPTIFEMFRQTQGSVRDGGVGVGLYIVKQFAEGLGGQVSVESQIGSGSRFCVTLPRRLPTIAAS